MGVYGRMKATEIFPKEIQPGMEVSRAEYLDAAREAARRLIRLCGKVNIDEVRAICPPPTGADPRLMGAVFRHPDFRKIGHTNSRRKKCHGRPIAVFGFANDE